MQFEKAKLEEKLKVQIKKNPLLLLLGFVFVGIFAGMILSALIKVLIPIAAVLGFCYLYLKVKQEKEIKVKIK